MIEDPVEIIGNDRELKGFYNMDEVIRLVGYFKSERSSRMLKIKTERLSFKKTLSNNTAFFFHVEIFFPFVFTTQISLSITMLLRSSTLSSNSMPHLTPRFKLPD